MDSEAVGVLTGTNEGLEEPLDLGFGHRRPVVEILIGDDAAGIEVRAAQRSRTLGPRRGQHEHGGDERCHHEEDAEYRTCFDHPNPRSPAPGMAGVLRLGQEGCTSCERHSVRR